jgi:hypothetical protein
VSSNSFCFNFFHWFIVLFVFHFSYFDDPGCSSLIQYMAYTEQYCYRQNAIVFSLSYPTKTVYRHHCNEPDGQVKQLNTNTCNNWPAIYGYADDDTLDPFSPYSIVAYVKTGTGTGEFLLLFFWSPLFVN